MKPCRIVFFALSCTTLVVLGACSTPEAKLTYSALPEAGAEGAGFPFVVPRTVVKVTPTADKSGQTESVSFAVVPLATAAGSKARLPGFVLTDSSSSGLSFTPTTVASVTYVDDLVISAIGTQLTDNRKDVIEVVVSAATLAGAFAAAATPNCASDTVPLKAFVIDSYGSPPEHLVPTVKCWGYRIEALGDDPVGRRAYPIAGLVQNGAVAWFPIPACKAYRIRVFRCADEKCRVERKGVSDFTTTVSLSNGESYRRIPLPAKGKVSLHTDFCGADTATDSVATSDWSLLKQLLSDVKAAKTE